MYSTGDGPKGIAEKTLNSGYLSNKYIHLTSNCGVAIECAPLNTGYNPPHMSYSIQWLFFAICLSIVILRKNKHFLEALLKL